MEKEDKDLLLRDLCARLPYGVFCEGITTDIDIDTDEYYNHKVKGVLSVIHHYNSDSDYATIGLMSECNLETIKPYLFPVSSMTEEQREEYDKMSELDIEYTITQIKNDSLIWTTGLNRFNWLLKNHFDVYDLIPMGLALDATGKNIY